MTNNSSDKLEISDEVKLRNNSLVPKQYRYTRAKSAETGLRPPGGIVKKLSFNLETQEIIPNGFYPAEQCSDNEDELDAYFKSLYSSIILFIGVFRTISLENEE